LKKQAGVIPPRTHIEPFVAKLNPALVGREIPIYNTGALQSQIVPGGPLDPYTNPPPSVEAIKKEAARLAALSPKIAEQMAAQALVDKRNEERRAYAKAQVEKGVSPRDVKFSKELDQPFAHAEPGLASRFFSAIKLPSTKEPLRLKDGRAVASLTDYQQHHLEEKREQLRTHYRRDPAAELFRIQFYQQLNPHLVIDHEKVKHFNVKEKFNAY
jgi:hypothetical protein